MKELNFYKFCTSSPKIAHPYKHLPQERAGGLGTWTAGWAAKPLLEAGQTAWGTGFSAAAVPEHRAAGGCPGTWCLGGPQHVWLPGWPALSPGKSELDNHENKPQERGNALLLQTQQPLWDRAVCAFEPSRCGGAPAQHGVAMFMSKEAFGVTRPCCPLSVELWHKGTVKAGWCWKHSCCFKVAYGTWLKIIWGSVT